MRAHELLLLSYFLFVIGKDPFILPRKWRCREYIIHYHPDRRHGRPRPAGPNVHSRITHSGQVTTHSKPMPSLT